MVQWLTGHAFFSAVSSKMPVEPAWPWEGNQQLLRILEQIRRSRAARYSCTDYVTQHSQRSALRPGTLFSRQARRDGPPRLLNGSAVRLREALPLGTRTEPHFPPSLRLFSSVESLCNPAETASQTFESQCLYSFRGILFEMWLFVSSSVLLSGHSAVQR